MFELCEDIIFGVTADENPEIDRYRTPKPANTNVNNTTLLINAQSTACSNKISV